MLGVHFPWGISKSSWRWVLITAGIIVGVILLAIVWGVFERHSAQSSIQSQLLQQTQHDYPGGPMVGADGNPMINCQGPNGTTVQCVAPSPSFVTCQMPSQWVPGNTFPCAVFDSSGNVIGTWTVSELPGNAWHATYASN